MKTYVITYDFATPDEHPAFFEELTTFEDWWHFLKDTWLIATELTAAEVFGKLRSLIDDRVNILVLEAGRDVAGYLPKKAWPWIEEHLNGTPEARAHEAQPANAMNAVPAA